MLDFLCALIYLWLFWKVAKVAFQVAWGTAKAVAAVLFVLALPILLLCLIFAGGLLLLIPLGMLLLAYGILRAAL